MKRILLIIVIAIVLVSIAIPVAAASETLYKNLTNTTYNEYHFGYETIVFYDYGTSLPYDDARGSTQISTPSGYTEGFASITLHKAGEAVFRYSLVISNSKVYSGIIKYDGVDFADRVDHGSYRVQNGARTDYYTTVINNG